MFIFSRPLGAVAAAAAMAVVVIWLDRACEASNDAHRESEMAVSLTASGNVLDARNGVRPQP